MRPQRNRVVAVSEVSKSGCASSIKCRAEDRPQSSHRAASALRRVVAFGISRCGCSRRRRAYCGDAVRTPGFSSAPARRIPEICRLPPKGPAHRSEQCSGASSPRYLLLWAGRPDEARAAVEQTRLKFPTELFATAMGGQLAALDGDFARAERLADEAGRSLHSLTHTHHTLALLRRRSPTSAPCVPRTSLPSAGGSKMRTQVPLGEAPVTMPSK